MCGQICCLVMICATLTVLLKCKVLVQLKELTPCCVRLLPPSASACGYYAEPWPAPPSPPSLQSHAVPRYLFPLLRFFRQWQACLRCRPYPESRPPSAAAAAAVPDVLSQHPLPAPRGAPSLPPAGAQAAAEERPASARRTPRRPPPAQRHLQRRT